MTMSTTNPNDRKTGRILTASMIITGLLGIACVAVWISSSPASTQGQKSPESSHSQPSLPDSASPLAASTATSSTDAGPSNGLLEYLPEQEDAALREVSTAFTKAFSQQSWNDPIPTAWLQRATPLATPAYAGQLMETYGSGRGGLAWQDFVKSRSETVATIVDAKVIRTDHLQQGTAQTMVTFDAQTTNGAGETTAAPLRFIKILTLVRINQSWAVDSFVNVTGDPGYAPQK
jgi:hypothetical protein